MTDEKKYILIRYISDLATHSQNYHAIGKRIVAVSHFLEFVDEISNREYKRYMKANAALYGGQNPFKREYILDFLSFAGVGCRKRKNKLKVLDRLSKISERNRQKINDFINWLPTKYDYSHHSIRIIRDGVIQFFEYCNDFNNENVRRFVATLEELGRSPATISSRVFALVTFGKFLGKQIIVKRPKVPRKLNTENIPSDEEYKKLLDLLKSRGRIRYYLYIRILATSGCRLSEFRQLKWNDIISGDVTLKCKGNKYRRLFFPESLQREVKDFLTKDVKGDDFVGMSRRGTRLADRSLNILLKSWGDAAGISKEKMHAHAFRHFFAKKFLASNKNDIMALADILGHSNIETTRIYTQKSYDEQKQDYNRTVTW